MTGNRALLERFFREGRIRVERSALFDTPPPLAPDLDFGRVRGMMLGLAIGDALGNTSESLLPAERRVLIGEVRDYLPNPRAGGRALGLPSDDTQLAFWTLERMVEDRGFVPERVARRFASEPLFGLGQTVAAFLNAFHAGRPWEECGQPSAGNGSLMRIAPMVIPHLASGTAELWVDTALSGMITHNDPAAVSACLAFVNLLWLLLARRTPPAPEWWVETYLRVARELEGEASYAPRGGAFRDYEGPLWRFVEGYVPRAFDQGRPVVEASDAWLSGAYLLETVPSVLYILMRHGDDPEEAVVRAVNDTVDNDTVGAIVGAAVGALHGARALPERWRKGLLGRTGADDDGRVQRLLDRAEQVFWTDAVGPAAGPVR